MNAIKAFFLVLLLVLLFSVWNYRDNTPYLVNEVRVMLIIDFSVC